MNPLRFGQNRNHQSVKIETPNRTVQVRLYLPALADRTRLMKPPRPPIMLFLVVMSPSLAVAQGAIPSTPQGATNPYEYRLRCKAPNPPANPYKRKFGCKDVHFDTKETLSGDWSGARSAALLPPIVVCPHRATP